MPAVPPIPTIPRRRPLVRGLIVLALAAVFASIDPAPSAAGVAPSPVAEHEGWGYFTGTSPERRPALFRTDGTPEGTTVVAPISLERADRLYVASGRLVLVNRENGRVRLVGTDGVVGQPFPATTGQDIVGAAVLDGMVVLERKRSQRVELLRVRPDFSGTDPVGRFTPPVRYLHASDGAVWFADGKSHRLWWVTTQGRAVRLGVGNRLESGADLQVSDGRAWFWGYDPAHGAEPWVSDGSAAGTRRLADTAPGRASGSSIHDPAVLDGAWYLLHRGGVARLTGAAIEPVTDPEGVPLDGAFRQIVRVGRTIWLEGERNRTVGRWSISAGTTVATALPERTFVPSGRDSLAHVGGLSYFVQSPGTIHRSDGTPEGSSSVDLPYVLEHKQFSLDSVYWSKPALGRFFYSAPAPVLGTTELWVTDGTPEGTELLTPPERFGPFVGELSIYRSDARKLGGGRYEFRVAGFMDLPRYPGAAARCGGRATIELRRGQRILKRVTATVDPDRCVFGIKVKVRTRRGPFTATASAIEQQERFDPATAELRPWVNPRR